MNKAERIRKLLREKELSKKEIAEKAGTTVNYVGAILRDIKLGGGAISRKRIEAKIHRKNNPELRNEQRKRNYAEGAKNNFCSGEDYASWEDNLILNFEGSDRELAEKIFRSVQGIQNHRYKLKKEGVVSRLKRQMAN